MNAEDCTTGVRASSWFLALFVILGTLVTFINPPFHVPDEQAHWVTANERSVRLTGGHLDRCAPSKVLNAALGSVAQRPMEQLPHGRYAALSEKNDDQCLDAHVDVPYGSVLTYFGVVAARGLIVGEDLSKERSLLVFFLARLFHGLAIAGLLARLIYLSSRRGSIPGTTTLLAFCLSPLFVHQAFAISSDPVCFLWAVSLATILLCYEQLRRFDVGMHAAATLIVAMTKPILLPAGMGAIFLAVLTRGPWSESGLSTIWRNRVRWKEGARSRIFVALASYTLGVVLAAIVTASIRANEDALPFPAGVDPSEQRAFILQNPVDAAFALARPLGLNMLPHLQAGPLGWLDFNPSLNTALTWVALMLLALAYDARHLRQNLAGAGKPKRAGPIALGLFTFLAGLAASVLAMGYAMFLFHTPVGSTVVGGIQPRYFTPIWILGIAALGALVSTLLPTLRLGQRDSEDETTKLAAPGWRSILFLFAGLGVSVLAIAYAVALFRTPSGSKVIDGIQPRYSTPLWLMGIAALGAVILGLTSKLRRRSKPVREKVFALGSRLLFGCLALYYITSLAIDFSVRYW